jgi:hypothetical protein
MMETPEPRRLACARCGAVFDCTRTQECWCNDQSFRLPMPSSDAEDCLCATCLAAAAAKSGDQAIESGDQRIKFKPNNET